jgi:hypothetical protein
MQESTTGACRRTLSPRRPSAMARTRTASGRPWPVGPSPCCCTALCLDARDPTPLWLSGCWLDYSYKLATKKFKTSHPLAPTAATSPPPTSYTMSHTSRIFSFSSITGPRWSPAPCRRPRSPPPPALRASCAFRCACACTPGSPRRRTLDSSCNRLRGSCRSACPGCR